LDFIVLISILGTVASVAGLSAALTQSVRLKQLKRRINADVWLSIRTVSSMINKLETSSSLKQDSNIDQVYGRTVDLYRHLLKKAVLEEKAFSEDTISKWRKVGKLYTDWQVSQARQFLQTNDI